MLYFAFPYALPLKLAICKKISHYWVITITLRHITLGRSILKKWSVRSKDLYLTSHNTHTRQIALTQSGFEPSFPASERRQTHTLSPAANGNGGLNLCNFSKCVVYELSLCSVGSRYLLTISYTTFGFVHISPCIIIHSIKSINQMHQSLRFIASRLTL